MSDLISREELIKKIDEYMRTVYGCEINEVVEFQTENESKSAYIVQGLYEAISAIENQPSIESPTWIPCSERLPKEHDSIFKKVKGTDKWSPAMFEGVSDDVNVTVEFDDGTRKTKTSHTLDGKWECEKDYGIKMKVIAWMPLPPAFKGE